MKSSSDILLDLKERAKELDCLYRVEDVLSQDHLPLDQICTRIVQTIPAGWQYPEVCQARIIFEGNSYATAGFVETAWVQAADIIVESESAGSVVVSYLREMPAADIGPFLEEEDKLIRTIAGRIADFVKLRRLMAGFRDSDRTESGINGNALPGWRAVLAWLERTDRTLLANLSRRMLFRLCTRGVVEAQRLYESWIAKDEPGEPGATVPTSGQSEAEPSDDSESRAPDTVFEIAARHFTDEKILSLIRRWVNLEKVGDLLPLAGANQPLADLSYGIRRFLESAGRCFSNSAPEVAGVRAALSRRILSDQLVYIGLAREYVKLGDLQELCQTVVPVAEGRGRVGGKAAALFLADKILRQKQAAGSNGCSVRIPKSVFITSALFGEFLTGLKLISPDEHKYKPPEQIQHEYPHLVKACREARLPEGLVGSLQVALDELDDRPLVVRSSSLLEDRTGRFFPDVYPSIILPNQGSKSQRLQALQEAIATIYASVFSPQAISFRTQNGLLDCVEEMGVMIQELVGRRLGRYFLPVFSAVALSRNDLTWLSDSRPSDGLLLLVPGLGTGAEIRPPDNCPMLFAPGRSGRPLYSNPRDIIQYSPRSADLVDLEDSTVRTVPLSTLIKETHRDFPGLENIVSVVRNGTLYHLDSSETDFKRDQFVATFNGLACQTPFMELIHSAMGCLQGVLESPLALDFACDAEHLYLLRCRQQAPDID